MASSPQIPVFGQGSEMYMTAKHSVNVGLYATVTGISQDAACFVFSIGVVIYTLFGGIKATFLTDWVRSLCCYHSYLFPILTMYNIGTYSRHIFHYASLPVCHVRDVGDRRVAWQDV